MNPSLPPLNSLLMDVILITLSIGLPIIMVLAIRFLWDRNLKLAQSRQIEKLIWQLHRIASALEQRMNLSFPAVQPGTEEPRDLAYLQQIAEQPNEQPKTAAASAAAAGAAAAATQSSDVPQPVSSQPAKPAPAHPAMPRNVGGETSARAGVNSMFDL